MPPKERETSSVGRPAPPKPAEEAAKAAEAPQSEVKSEKVAVPAEESTQSPAFVAVTSIKYVAPDGEEIFIKAGEVVTGFSESEMVAFHEMGSIRQK